MATTRIRLLHDSNHPGAEGAPGDVIECDSAIAEQFISGRGAELVAAPGPKVEPEPKPAAPKKTTRRKTTKKADSE